MIIKKTLGLLIILAFSANFVSAGITFVKSQGITLTGADGITLTGADGITLTGADGFLGYKPNGITLTGADGIPLTGADGITLTGADGSTYTGTDGITLTGADGITLTGADGITLTGADGITLTGADGTQYHADAIKAVQPNGITLTGADGITLTGADGFVPIGTDGITLTGADGITLTGADGITLTGADSIVGFNANGTSFNLTQPNGITLTGADGITLTGADGITLTGADGITLTGADGETGSVGLQSIDPELAIALNAATDDSTLNAVVVFHQYPNSNDLNQLRQAGILGGTLFRVLPMIIVSGTRSQIAAVSRLPQVRTIYGKRSLALNSDPYFNKTQVQRVKTDTDLLTANNNQAVSGRGVTVAVLDTGVNSLHGDLAGKVIQNVRLSDLQSVPLGFQNPLPIENVANTDLGGGHGTFVAGIIAGSGALSNGRYGGVAPGAKILGLAAGDLNLTHILAGFDYILERGENYNVRVVNCSFSANTIFDLNDPVNIATKMLTDRNVNVVFSAGNTGAGNGTLNPYSAAPWVVSVGATDEKGKLAGFSSRGVFGNPYQKPSIVAPGVNVVSLRSLATQTGTLGLVTGADIPRLSLLELPFYTTASGTSFTAPQVAGAIALMLETNPTLHPKEVKDILQRSATTLPKYYSHEAGAGMLNTYAAVLEAAFPNRKTGVFRSILDKQNVSFTNSVIKNFSGTVAPGAIAQTSVTIPAGTIQSTVTVAWGGLLSLNDLGLKVLKTNGTLLGESNYLNLPGLTGKREKVSLENPVAETLQLNVAHTLGLGTTQNFDGTVEATRVQIDQFDDVNSLPISDQNAVNESLRSFLMLSEGSKFRPSWQVSRSEFAETLVRGGTVPQFVAMNQKFLDVNDLTTRSVVESVQSNPSGKLIYDASNGGNFRPNDAATKLVAAVAFVKAAGFENLTASTALPSNMTDTAAIPTEWRGFVAVALQKGFLTLDGNQFNPSRSLTRLELTKAMVKLKNLE
jgi:serine protease AprX